MSRSPFSEQEAKDKKMIDRGIVEAKRFLESKNFDSAKEKLSQISPPSRRLNYKQYDIAILYSFLMSKQEKWQEAKPYVQSATRLKPDEPVPWKLLIQVESKIGTDESLKQTLKRAMETSRPDGSLLLFIGPYLKKFDDESLTDDFTRLIELIPNGLNLPLVSFIPEIPKTLDIRTRMLEQTAKSNEESCSELIHILLSEGDPFKSMKYAEMLPEDHPDRLYVETMIGDDPVGSARKHLKTGNNRFFDFLRAVDSHNLQQIRSEVSVIPSFVSGWAYLATQEKDPKARILLLNDASSKFPKCATFFKLLAETKEEINDIDGAITTIKRSVLPIDAKLGSEMLIRLFIRQGRCKEAMELISTDNSIVVSDADKAKIEFEMYKQDGNMIHLQKIINDFPQSPELAVLKAEAAWNLRDNLGDECEKLFGEALKCDRTNGQVFLMFGKWQLESKHDEEKAAFLLSKAAELGFVDSQSVELLSRKLIQEEKIDDALNLLQKVDNEWSHFRAALIYQRKGDHESSAREFQLDLKYNPSRLISWSAIGHEYVVLGRAMAANSVADYLRQIGSPDISLEFELCSIFGRPINNLKSGEEIEFDVNPIPFYAYLQQTIETIQNLTRLGRKETARYLADQIKPTVRLYSKKWNSLSTVLKICGDFFILSSSLSSSIENDDDAKEALVLFKKRCEADKRAESFIDLARAIQIQKNQGGSQKVDSIEMSIVVLRKVLKSFPDHAGLWTALGVSYALASRFPFARHCLCVAAKLATDMEQARSYACCANVALLINDSKLLEESIEAARSANPYDADVWQILAASKQSETSDKMSVEEAIIAFQFGASDVVSKCLPKLCLKSGRLTEALGFSLILQDDEEIASSFEALGKYDMALLYEKDEKKRDKLLCLANSMEAFKKFPNLELYKEGNFKDAALKFSEKNDFYSNLAAAVCYSKSGEIEKALQIFNELRKLDDHLSFQIEKIMLKVLPNDAKIESSLSLMNPELFFLNQLRSFSRIDAARNLIKRFPSDLSAISIFVVECLKSKAVDAVDDNALTKARALYKDIPGLKSLALLTMCLVRLDELDEALKNLQVLCFLDPNLTPKLKVIINSLLSKRQENH